jgi:hypothetical protein
MDRVMPVATALSRRPPTQYALALQGTVQAMERLAFALSSLIPFTNAHEILRVKGVQLSMRRNALEAIVNVF